jgi:hypothetical protein
MPYGPRALAGDTVTENERMGSRGEVDGWGLLGKGMRMCCSTCTVCTLPHHITSLHFPSLPMGSQVLAARSARKGSRGAERANLRRRPGAALWFK